MRATVLLHHRFPTGSSHLDWLIQTSEDPAARVLAFRLPARCRPDRAEMILFTAERLADHRPFYLDHEGEVPGGRGAITRLAKGEIIDLKLLPSSVELQIRFGGEPYHLIGHRKSGDIWLFERL